MPGDRAPSIERLASDGLQIVVASGDGAAKIEARHDIRMEVILAGINARPHDVPKHRPNSNERLRVEEMETALAEASDTHDAVFEWLDELFMDVLQKAGGDIESLEALEETSLD